MEEKKKRWRPSLTAYRDLEKKLANSESRIADYEKLRIENEACVRENEELKKKVKHLEDWLADKKKRIDSLSSIVKNNHDALVRKEYIIERLMARGLWARILNEEVEDDRQGA